MIAELGQFALVLAFCLCIPQAFFGIVGAQQGKVQWMLATRPAVAGQWVFTLLAFGCLAYTFYVNDFSVAVCREQFQFRAADVLSLCGRVGSA